ncbi:DUF1987 domain-containing protein [Bacteroidota bacterium]
MENYNLEGTARTPTIELDRQAGTILLEGKSSPENAREFYEPIIAWMEEYIKDPAETTSLTINLEHFNTSSSKYLMEVFRKIRYLADKNMKYTITWMYEEDDHEMLDTAETYEVMTGMIFKKVSYPEPSV